MSTRISHERRALSSYAAEDTNRVGGSPKQSGPGGRGNYNAPNAAVIPLPSTAAVWSMNVTVNLVAPGTIYGDREPVDTRAGKSSGLASVARR